MQRLGGRPLLGNKVFQFQFLSTLPIWVEKKHDGFANGHIEEVGTANIMRG